MTLQDARDDLTQHYLSMRDELLKAIDGLTEAQMDEPTLDGWSVKDQLSHLAFWHDLRASEIARISAGYETVWRLSESSDGINDIVQKARAGLSVRQVLWELDSARQRVLNAITGINERGLDVEHYGEVGFRSTHDLEHVDYIRRWRQERGI
jgi:hypothetical protein